MSDAATPGAPTASRIELVEASGPVSPRHSYKTTIVLSFDPSAPGGAACVVRDHRDASGEHHDEREIDRAGYEALLAEVLVSLPLASPLDLVGAKRDRKGVSFNHVVVVVGAASTRLDYLLSDVEEDDGDPRARSVVTLVKAVATRTIARKIEGLQESTADDGHMHLRVLRHLTHRMLLSIPARPSTRTRLIPGLSLRAGDTLPGGYRALSLLRADRACAYLAALHTSSNRRVDVQVLLAMDDAIEAVHLRFLADARKAAALDNPNVERVLHVGVTDDGHPFVVRERAAGEPLATLLSKMGSLPTEHAVDIAIAICRALESAHAVGLLHAELDPTTVRLDWTAAGAANVRVSGLGTSRALATLPSDARSFMSLALRAPELLSAEVVDARADIWGVGVLLYTMLAGELPFAAESPSKMDVSSTGDEPALLAGVPDGLGEIVDACLARNPAVRPQTAASLAARLSLFGSHPVFDERAPSLAVDTGPYDVTELERALREAKPSERDVQGEPVLPLSASPKAAKTSVPVTVTTSTASTPPVAMTLPPERPLHRATLQEAGARPTPRLRAAAIAAAACVAAGAFAIAGSLHFYDGSGPRATGLVAAAAPLGAPFAAPLADPVAEPVPIGVVASPSSVAPPPPVAIRALPQAVTAAAGTTPRVRPRVGPSAVDPLVRSSTAPTKPQPKASDDELRRFLDDRR